MPFLTAYCFFYLFLPPVASISILSLITVFNVVFIILQCVKRQKVILKRELLCAILGFGIHIILFYIFQGAHYISDISHQLEIAEFTKQHTLIIIHTTIACIFLAMLCNYYGLTLNRFLIAIALAGMIQLVLVLVSLQFPSIRMIFVDTITKNVRSERLAEAVNRYLYLRSYGFASNLMDGFGYVTALIIVLSFLKGISDKNKKLTTLSLVMIIMPLLNTRTGLILSFMGILIIILTRLNLQNMRKYVNGAIFVFLLFICISRFIPEHTLQWASRGITQTLDLLFKGDGSAGVYTEIFQADLQFPANFLFGAGLDPNKIGIAGIDSGYVQCIWRYGLLGTLVLFSAIISYFLFFWNRIHGKTERTMLVLLPMLLFVYLLKISGLENPGGNFIIFGTPIVAFCSYKNTTRV